jgi:hypothetical protein
MWRIDGVFFVVGTIRVFDVFREKFNDVRSKYDERV